MKPSKQRANRIKKGGKETRIEEFIRRVSVNKTKQATSKKNDQ
jgi:hypothetical protein